MATITIICSACERKRYDFPDPKEPKDKTQKAGLCEPCVQDQLDAVAHHPDNDVTQG